MDSKTQSLSPGLGPGSGPERVAPSDAVAESRERIRDVWSGLDSVRDLLVAPSTSAGGVNAPQQAYPELLSRINEAMLLTMFHAIHDELKSPRRLPKTTLDNCDRFFQRAIRNYRLDQNQELCDEVRRLDLNSFFFCSLLPSPLLEGDGLSSWFPDGGLVESVSGFVSREGVFCLSRPEIHEHLARFVEFESESGSGSGFTLQSHDVFAEVQRNTLEGWYLHSRAHLVFMHWLD